MGFVGRESCRGGADVDSVLRWCGMESGRGNDVAITELPMSREMTGLGCDMAEAQCGGEGERATRELEADKDGGINGEVHVSMDEMTRMPIMTAGAPLPIDAAAATTEDVADEDGEERNSPPLQHEEEKTLFLLS